jgi:superfamily II DNA helicase RecQ
MSNFFKHAPAHETDQKRFLEAVTKGQNVIASFPLGYPVVSLYAFAAMLGGGLVVAVCPSARHIRRNLDYFKAAGFKFPDVAYLDGTQMPHEERTVQREVNHNRVRLLYTTPERFTSLTFLEILVHADVHFMLIEEADRFLPVTLGHPPYRRFQEEGLDQLRRLPPLALMTPPMPPRRYQELSARLDLGQFQSIQSLPLIEPVEVRVQTHVTEHQKFDNLVNVLSGNPGIGKQGRLDIHGSVLIQTAYPAQAEKLGATLLDHGFESVHITHFKKNSAEQARVLEIANTRQNAIIVNAGSDMRSWQPPEETRQRLIFWTPPISLEDLFVQVFRHTTATPSTYESTHFMKALVLYTKEDFQAAIKRVQHSRTLDDGEMREKIHALKQFRRWVLSEPCRLHSLAALFQGAHSLEVLACGKCDRCLERRMGKKVWLPKPLGQLVQKWMF